MSDDSAAAESATRQANGRRVSALLDAEQLSRISLHTSAESAAALERSANQSAAGDALDKEQAERVAEAKALDDDERHARWEAQKKAQEAISREQVSHIAGLERADRDSKAERGRNQSSAAAALDAEQHRRIFETEQADEAAKVEREANQKAAGEALDEEQRARAESGTGRRKSVAAALGVLDELVSAVAFAAPSPPAPPQRTRVYLLREKCQKTFIKKDFFLLQARSTPAGTSNFLLSKVPPHSGRYYYHDDDCRCHVCGCHLSRDRSVWSCCGSSEKDVPFCREDPGPPVGGPFINVLRRWEVDEYDLDDLGTFGVPRTNTVVLSEPLSESFLQVPNRMPDFDPEGRHYRKSEWHDHFEIETLNASGKAEVHWFFVELNAQIIAEFEGTDGGLKIPVKGTCEEVDLIRTVHRKIEEAIKRASQ